LEGAGVAGKFVERAIFGGIPGEELIVAQQIEKHTDLIGKLEVTF
jgi:hypothetical protein